ncbi:AbrB/MazE/SpoVT family DNA-binding domain-containing protein [Leptospira bandrabouensis]|uniref:AbrB/MazE/SpoVT family DNA-binding domain-containing protein n=1 Tax=Leptospira bandrabouensis TaxID=2484903 RepID=UPI00223E6A67|nr:AbrB/MazE/SpoVT family DNA-binding domain-containing protein [Leptospira bandrabouensis]MCW7479476.1 AbrB/MazE/SpoVT family DNA-binding domain-containing protein [Leptospira bandrabouensis]MCW7487159.1 AbrB/MazE/SpoVT family DNA-binding domain-containing protein [Leptospira bandrabouensis]
MLKKLVQHGNSSAIVIEKPILELLNIDQNSTLEVTTDGKSLIIKPVSKSVLKSLDKINKNHSKTLKKLAQ